MMEKALLRSKQKPLKEKYLSDPSSAKLPMKAKAQIEGPGISCKVESFLGEIPAGLHPGTGGDGTEACSAKMMLESLVGCAGVTLRAVATAMEIGIEKSSSIEAIGHLDFRGTLGLDRSIPVGFEKIELIFDLKTDCDDEKTEKMIELTERYCVVYQTIKTTPILETRQASLDDN